MKAMGKEVVAEGRCSVLLSLNNWWEIKLEGGHEKVKLLGVFFSVWKKYWG